MTDDRPQPTNAIVFISAIDLAQHVEDCTLTYNTAEHIEAACFIALSSIEEPEG